MSYEKSKLLKETIFPNIQNVEHLLGELNKIKKISLEEAMGDVDNNDFVEIEKARMYIPIIRNKVLVKNGEYIIQQILSWKSQNLEVKTNPKNDEIEIKLQILPYEDVPIESLHYGLSILHKSLLKYYDDNMVEVEVGYSNFTIKAFDKDSKLNSLRSEYDNIEEEIRRLQRKSNKIKTEIDKYRRA